jgi:hypothetical protein
LGQNITVVDFGGAVSKYTEGFKNMSAVDLEANDVAMTKDVKKREDDRSGGILVSDWVGSDSAQCLEFSLDAYPWRAVPKAKYLVGTFPSITDGKNWE